MPQYRLLLGVSTSLGFVGGKVWNKPLLEKMTELDVKSLWEIKGGKMEIESGLIRTFVRQDVCSDGIIGLYADVTDEMYEKLKESGWKISNEQLCSI